MMIGKKRPSEILQKLCLNEGVAMKFIKFNDSTIDSFLFMMLTDLAKTLTKSEAVEVEYGVQSYYNPFEKKIYMSHFWKDRAD